MTDRDRYKETFSQVHSRRELNWEEFEHMERKRKKYRPLRFLAAAAAVALLVGAPTLGAIAANFLGLGDLMPLSWGTRAQPLRGLEDLVLPVESGDGEARPLSLSGYNDTPESRALAEWLQFQKEYDPDGTILGGLSNTLDQSLANYNAYLVYTPEMAQKLEEIAAKYDLKLHKTMYDTTAHPELVEPLGDFLGQAPGQVYNMYEDGTFHVDDWVTLTTGDYGVVEFQLQRSVKGTFHDALVYLDPGQFTQWDYTTQRGLRVKLALGPNRSMILVDFKDCFVTVLVLGGVEQYIDMAIAHALTPAHLEELADQLDLGLLSPVVTPQPDPEPSTTPNPPAGERTDARETYAALLRDLLNSGVLPDGTPVEEDPDYDTFAVWDVDGDDREELVLLHISGITAGMTGYVIDFDEGYTGGGAPIYIQMSDYPMFTFYSGGYMTAGASHNQGWAGEVLWPYSLYRHTEGDSYTCIATVDAWDADRWPDAYGEGSEAAQVHQRNGGAVYFVSYTYASELPDDRRSLVLDRDGYDAWLEELALGEAVAFDYLPLTQANVTAMEQGLSFRPGVAEALLADSLASENLPTDAEKGFTVLGSRDFPLTVDGDRDLTLRVHRRAVASGYGYWDYGVESMEVLENGELLQTLSVLDAQEAGGDSVESGWTQGWESDYLPECWDLNFDGSDDIRLLDSRGVVNGRYLHWLWNGKTGQFEYAFTLVGYDFEVDWGTKQLRTTARNGGDHTTEVYTYDKNGNLFLVNVLDVSPDD